MLIALGVIICLFIIILIVGGIIADKKMKEAYQKGYNDGRKSDYDKKYNIL